jgi:hypothetical protein
MKLIQKKKGYHISPEAIYISPSRCIDWYLSTVPTREGIDLLLTCYLCNGGVLKAGFKRVFSRRFPSTFTS